MNEDIVQLYPNYGTEHALAGLYLSHQIRALASPARKSYVYANFITSLDGRIAVPQPAGGGVMLAEAITNPRDWRLFRELAVQADVLITSGRYLRSYPQGAKQEILTFYEHGANADLRAWRLDHELPLHPDLAVISASLDFPPPDSALESGRRLFVLTTDSAPADRRRSLEAGGAHVLVVGTESVDGGRAVQSLEEHGCRTIYSAAGPKILHLLLEADVLDRLYLTFAHQLLGGHPYASIVEGPLLDPPRAMVLNELYFDSRSQAGSGQLFASYNLNAPPTIDAHAPSVARQA